MLRELHHSDQNKFSKSGSRVQEGWLHAFVNDYRRRIISLLSYSFSRLEISLAITLLEPGKMDKQNLISESSGASEEMITANSDFVKGPRTTEFAPLTASELLSVHLSHVIF
jgi:hypothetical protein